MDTAESTGNAGVTRKVVKLEGGGGASPGTIVQMTATHVPGTPGARAPVGTDSALTQKGAVLSSATAAAAAPAKGGGTPPPSQVSGPMKVILAAPKKNKPKVLLAAATPAPAAAAAATAASGGGKTRKATAARKVRMNMKGLSRKLKRARTIRVKAEKESVESIKKELHKAGLIKADSKAPEGILRQMYADFLTLKNRAL